MSASASTMAAFFASNPRMARNRCIFGCSFLRWPATLLEPKRQFTGIPRRVIPNLLGFPAAQFRLISWERVMVLPKVVALSVQLIIPVAGADRLPQLDVEPVCKGIAEQGGVTFS